MGTPSIVTLAPEGGAHQFIGTQTTSILQDGLASFEPAFADEPAIIMQGSFDYVQRDGEGDPDERTWLGDETGGSYYLRLMTKPVEQLGQTGTIKDLYRHVGINRDSIVQKALGSLELSFTGKK